MFSFNNINQNFPIRRTDEQKNKFIDFVKTSVKNYNVTVERSANKHNNIVIGDVQNAEVVFTAHYDTPARSFYPNLMLPRSPILGFSFHFAIPIVMAIIAVLISALLYVFIKMSPIVLVLICEAIYLSTFYFGTRFFTNKNNYNDNTSGVCCVLKTCSMINSNKIAFILFDNEERGLLGSKAFKKEHVEILKYKLVINLDCVGVGDHFLFICKKTAENHPLYERLKDCFSIENSNKFVHFFGTKGSMANSDQKSFDCSIGVMACTKSKSGIFYTSKIHTNNDRFIDETNLNFLPTTLAHFIEKI